MDARGEPKLVFRKGPNQGRIEPLSGDRVTIGRNPSNEIALDVGLTVSSFHAALVRHPDDGSWWLEDLRSKNGTFLNGERIERVRLNEGDVISFARQELEIEFTTGDPVIESGFLDPTVTAGGSPRVAAIPFEEILKQGGGDTLAIGGRWRRTGPWLAAGGLAAAAAVALFLVFGPPRPPAVPEDIAVSVTPHIDPIYGCLFLSYRAQPIGTATVTNTGPSAVSGLELVFTFENDGTGFVVVPFTAPVPDLAPGATEKIDLLPRLSTDVLSPQTREVTAQVQVIRANEILAEKQTAVFVHGQNVFNWDTPERITAFVDPHDPALAAFVREAWHRRPASSREAFPPQRIRDAVCLFTGLSELGLRYMPDARTPISARVDWKANDRVNYPWETLTSRTGDCDDLSVLCAAALEAVDIPAAIVVCPRHVFMMFDCGLAPGDLDRTPLDPATVVVWSDRVWLPVETTVFGRHGAGFLAAWAEGWTRREAVAAKETAVVEIRSGWKDYHPMNPTPDERTQEIISERAWAAGTLAARIGSSLDALEQLCIQNLDARVTRLVEELPAGPERDRAIGALYTQSGLFDQARRAFEKAVFAVAGEEAPAGDLAAALDRLTPQPEIPYLLFDLGCCLTLGAGSPEDLTAASRCYERGLALLPGDDTPDRGEFVLRLALVNRLRGDLAAEKRWADEAFRLAPFLRETYRELVAGEGARAGENEALRGFLLKGLRR
jgi:hypothetical protein